MSKGQDTKCTQPSTSGSASFQKIRAKVEFEQFSDDTIAVMLVEVGGSFGLACRALRAKLEYEAPAPAEARTTVVPQWKQERAQAQAAAAKAHGLEAEAIAAARGRAFSRPLKVCVFQYVKRNGGVQQAVELLEHQLNKQPGMDVALFPEFFCNSDDPRKPDEPEHRFTAAMAQVAARHGVFVAYSGSTAQNGVYYNTAALLGPTGELQVCSSLHITVQS